MKVYRCPCGQYTLKNIFPFIFPTDGFCDKCLYTLKAHRKANTQALTLRPRGQRGSVPHGALVSNASNVISGVTEVCVTACV